VELIPTLVLVDIPYEDDLVDRSSGENRTPSPSSRLQVESLCKEMDIGKAYGIKLLQCITSEIQYQSLSKLVVPIAVVSTSDHSAPATSVNQSLSVSQTPAGSVPLLDQARTIQYLDAGAVDVLTSPLLQERLPTLGIHAYRAHRDASKDQRALLEMKRGRKRSWVGVDDQKPYAYLREAMVSGLMDGICTLGAHDEPPSHVRISVARDRQQKVAEAVGSWCFSAHEFTDDELLHASLLMLQHALSMPELERWRVSTGKLGVISTSCLGYYSMVHADTRCRISHRISGRQPFGVQCLCSISQLPPRRRRLAGNLLLPCATGTTTTISARQSP
jgi:3',5'-cyclic-nucleotide phosphodiesterase